MSTSSSLLVHNCTIFLPWMLEIWWSMQRSQYEGERSSCWVTNYIIANIIIIIIMIIIREMDKTGNLLLPRLLSPLSPLSVLLSPQRRHLLLNLRRTERATSRSILRSAIFASLIITFLRSFLFSSSSLLHWSLCMVMNSSSALYTFNFSFVIMWLSRKEGISSLQR